MMVYVVTEWVRRLWRGALLTASVLLVFWWLEGAGGMFTERQRIAGALLAVFALLGSAVVLLWVRLENTISRLDDVDLYSRGTRRLHNQLGEELKKRKLVS